jgi:hypothetical protein
MRQIKLEFTSGQERDILLADKIFASEIEYLKPLPAEPNGLFLFDPVQEHFSLDTEVVVLTLFAKAFKRIMFPTTIYDIEFLSPLANKSKIGIRHNQQILISNNQREV